MSRIVKFAHFADLHLGGWREKRLTQLNFMTFRKAVDRVVSEGVEFVIFAGDIFNNAMPPIELVTQVVREFMKLKEAGIGVYIVGGSHDYSDSGKSFLELLESSGVFVNVANWEAIDKGKFKLKFTRDERSGTVFAGVLGKRNGLEKNVYLGLVEPRLSEQSFNVFVFHSLIDDFKPAGLEGVKSEIKLSFLPTGFDFYAGGHVHSAKVGKYGRGVISYPGALFPNNFLEVRFEKPGFNLCEFDFESRDTKVRRVNLEIYEKVYISVEFDGEDCVLAREKILEEIDRHDFSEKLVLLEVSGVVSGRVADVELNKVVGLIYEKGAFQVLRNSYKLRSESLEDVFVVEGEDVLDLEEKVIGEYLDSGSESFNEEFESVRKLLSLELGKIEGEKVIQYEQRVVSEIEKGLKSRNE